jgi:hypothetical protein
MVNSPAYVQVETKPAQKAADVRVLANGYLPGKTVSGQKTFSAALFWTNASFHRFKEHVLCRRIKTFKNRIIGKLVLRFSTALRPMFHIGTHGCSNI